MNHYYETLFSYVARIIELPESDKELCQSTFSPLKAPKGTLLEMAGKVPMYHNFIVSGYMRKYYVDDRGEEITVDLNDGPRFFTSYFPFVTQTVSNEFLYCVTDCELLRITKADADSSAAISVTQKDYTIKLFQIIQEEDRQRMNDLATLTAEQRYAKFVKENPNIIKNIPLKYIASYLGIKPESLSRIRRDYIS